MKKVLNFLLIALMAFSLSVPVADAAVKKTVKPIKVHVPKRAKGQTDVVNLVTPKMEVVRVGFIGLGMRGPGAVSRFTHIEGTDIKALCDLYPERVENVQKNLEKAGRPRCLETALRSRRY